MKLLDIRVLGDPILRKETTAVDVITDDVRELIGNMFTTMYAAEGIGLAAPQVGRTERVCVVHVDDAKLALINPEILDVAGSARAEEGCLSIPDIYGDVDRPEHVRVKAVDENGAPIDLTAEGLLARCLQHEVDHLHGKLFIDYLGLFKRRSAIAEWERVKDKYPGFIRKITPGEPKPRPSAARHATTHTPEQTGEI